MPQDTATRLAKHEILGTGLWSLAESQYSPRCLTFTKCLVSQHRGQLNCHPSTQEAVTGEPGDGSQCGLNSENKEDSNGQANREGEKFMGPQPNTKNYGQLGNVESREMVFLRQDTPIWYSKTRGQPWAHIHICNIMQTGRVIYVLRNIPMYVCCMFICHKNERKKCQNTWVPGKG